MESEIRATEADSASAAVEEVSDAAAGKKPSFVKVPAPLPTDTPQTTYEQYCKAPVFDSRAKLGFKPPLEAPTAALSSLCMP